MKKKLIIGCASVLVLIAVLFGWFLSSLPKVNEILSVEVVSEKPGVEAFLYR